MIILTFSKVIGFSNLKSTTSVSQIVLIFPVKSTLTDLTNFNLDSSESISCSASLPDLNGIS